MLFFFIVASSKIDPLILPQHEDAEVNHGYRLCLHWMATLLSAKNEKALAIFHHYINCSE